MLYNSEKNIHPCMFSPRFYVDTFPTNAAETLSPTHINDTFFTFYKAVFELTALTGSQRILLKWTLGGGAQR